MSLKLPNGEVLEVCLQPYDTMSKLYDIAATKLGVKCDLIRIKYTGKILQKTQSARHLGILSGMVLKSEVWTALQTFIVGFSLWEVFFLRVVNCVSGYHRKGSQNHCKV